MNLMRASSRMNIIDTKDKIERVNVSLAGVAEILDGPLVRRLAAAADMPVSLLFGQVQGALGGDAGSTETRYFYDSVRSEQNNRLVPALERLYALDLLSREGPTKGVMPERWAAVCKPLWQPTPQEKAQERLTTAQADQIEIGTEVVTPGEVTSTRYGGAEYNTGPIMLDLPERERVSKAMEKLPDEDEEPPPSNELDEPPAPGGEVGRQPASPPEAVSQPIFRQVPAMTAMPIDPITAAPVSVPSQVNETGKNGKPIAKHESE
jgi:hypothetical protein